MSKEDTKYDTFDRLNQPYPPHIEIEVIKVQAKSRQLKATWTVETVQDFEDEA